MNLSVRKRVAIAVVAVAIGATFGWLTTPHLDPARYGIEVLRYEAGSDRVDGPLEQVAVRSKDATRGLVAFLHGRGGSPDEMLSDELFAALDGLDDEAPVVVFPSGGESSYWHDRQEGAWATYVVEEVIPAAVERFDLDEERVTVGGISMGGFGALSLALDRPDRFCAVGGHSPAVFRSWEGSAAGAFDDQADFERHDLFDRSYRRLDMPVWLDVGRDDPFAGATEDLAATLEESGIDVELNLLPGDHDEAYWWSHIDDYLRFYSTALATC